MGAGTGKTTGTDGIGAATRPVSNASKGGDGVCVEAGSAGVAKAIGATGATGGTGPTLSPPPQPDKETITASNHTNVAILKKGGSCGFTKLTKRKFMLVACYLKPFSS